CAYDRVFCTRLGTGAAKLIRDDKFGFMVGIINGNIVSVPLADCAGKLKSVPADCDQVISAKEIGISFGD
ncbi:MAG: 6-phosphofructokinase, partial [Oscillospiraceae bacterium]